METVPLEIEPVLSAIIVQPAHDSHQGAKPVTEGQSNRPEVLAWFGKWGLWALRAQKIDWSETRQTERLKFESFPYGGE